MRLLSASRRVANPLAARVALSNVLPLGVFQPRRNVSQPAYDGHIPLNWAENAFLAAGSAVMSLIDPRRGDMIAALGETTGAPALPRLREQMLDNVEGRRVLRERPRVNSETVDMDKLSQLPHGTFGRAYMTWLDRCGVTPDTREPVHYIDDPELAYVIQRYRECHDFYHCITDMPVSVEYELALKFFEFAHFGLPMAGISAAFGHLRLDWNQRNALFRDYVPWALRCGASAKPLIAVYWEERWEQNVEEIKREFGIWDPPPPDWSKVMALSEAKKAKKGKAALAAAQGQPPNELSIST